MSDRDDPDRPECEAETALNCDYEIYKMPTDDSTQIRLTRNVPADDWSPDWQAR